MQVRVQQFRGCERAEFEVSRIALLIGDGGASKTSILRAISLAATGQKIMPGINIKDAKARMVRRGADKGSVVLTEGESWEIGIKWPKCEVFSTGRVPFVSPFAAGLESILDSEPKKRAALLAPILKTDPSPLDLVTALRDSEVSWPTKGIATQDEVAPMKELRLDPMNQRDTAVYRIFLKIWPTIEKDGWDGAHRQASTTNTEMRGQWKQATGGESYGKVKAEEWEPKGWDDALSKLTVEALQKQLDDAKSAHEAAIAAKASASVNFVALKALADNIPALEADLAAAQGEKTAASATCHQFAIRAYPMVPDGGIPCPHCGGMVQIEQPQDLLAADHGPGLKKAQPVDAATIAAATKARKAHLDAVAAAREALNTADLKVRKLNDDLAEARKAKTTIDNSSGQADAAIDVDATRAKAVELSEKLAALKAKTEADRLHRQIQVNEALVALLSENGVRRQKLVNVLESFNESILGSLCATAKWKPVTITPELEVEYGGIPYPDLCKSEQHRVMFVLQIAIAKVDGSGLLVIDDADALPINARGGLISMLKEVGIPAVVAMMVPSPDKAPDLAKGGSGVTVWVEAGVTESYADASARLSAKATRKAA